LSDQQCWIDNVGLTKRQRDKKATWQEGNLTKMATVQKINLTKRHFDKKAILTKWQLNKKANEKMST
jgi:hypothetical protein